MKRRAFIQGVPAAAVMAGQTEKAGGREAAYLRVAEALKPKLKETRHGAARVVRAVEAPGEFLRYRMENAGTVEGLKARLLKRGDSFIVDFGRHMAGYVSFALEGAGEAVDAPVRLRLTFGEAPADVAEAMESYKGTLAIAWLPDEVVNVDFLPRRVEHPRRHAFRYVKFDVIDTSPNFAVRFVEIEARAVTSAWNEPAALPAGTPELLRRIDEVGLATLRDCMQTVFEDGPRRDRRLWIGDLRLQAMVNYVSFRNLDLVKRCLYLFAGLPREDGLLAACVYDEPKPLCGRQFIMDYAVLYAAAVLDYVKAAKAPEVARELWPVVKRQFELITPFVKGDGMFADPGGWWIFVDWREELEKTAAMHGILMFSLRQARELARMAGDGESVGRYGALLEKMRAAARAQCWDAGRGVFVSGAKRQVSWATQAWMVLAGVATAEEGARALRGAMADQSAVRPGTPYLYHYMVEAMLGCGMNGEGRALLERYWGGMVRSGADTFWEIYDPADPLLSPYKSTLVNSYCHAWSCTPSHFLRGVGLG